MLLKTSKDERHTHVVYMRQDGTGQCAEAGANKKSMHTHDIYMGQLVPAMDGHTHMEMSPVAPSKKKKERKDEEVVSRARQLFKEAKNIEHDSRQKGKESEEFRANKQWKKSEKAKLEGEDRAALTLNQVAPTLNILGGYQRQNRTDIKYFPVEGGDGIIADILTAVTKRIFDVNDYEYKESQVFDDEITTGRGFFHIFIDRNRNMEGDIVIEKYPWDEVYLGPHRDFLLADCEYLVKSKWYSKAKLMNMWPDKAKEIGKTPDDDEPTTHRTVTTGDQYAEGEQKPVSVSDTDPDFVDIAKKEYRLVEVWEKEYKRVKVAAMADDDFYQSTEDFEDSDISAIGTLTGFELVQQQVSRMRVYSVAGATLLDDGYSDVPADDFTIIPVYANKIGDDFWGKVEDCKDAQREINKRHSQLADILNKCAAYGWFTDNDTFESPKEERAFKKNSSKAAFVQKVRDLNKVPLKSEGIKFPNEIAAFANMEVGMMREILGVNPELLGQSGKAESGVAILEKKRAGLIGNEYLFDNLSMGKKKLGKLIIPHIQKCFTPKRILRLLENTNKTKPVELGGQPFDAYPQEEILTMLETKWDELTQYDISIGESLHTQTSRQANLMILKEMAGQGMPIPPEEIMEFMDMPNKERIVQKLLQIQQQAQEMEQKKFDTEIQKSMIAQQGKMAGQAPEMQGGGMV